jgi:hypothetical protein
VQTAVQFLKTPSKNERTDSLTIVISALIGLGRVLQPQIPIISTFFGMLLAVFFIYGGVGILRIEPLDSNDSDRKLKLGCGFVLIIAGIWLFCTGVVKFL